MFRCERCGSGFSPARVRTENCPRCLGRDGVESPLTFRLLGPRVPPQNVGADLPPPGSAPATMPGWESPASTRAVCLAA
jgi:hypothetical protein